MIDLPSVLSKNKKRRKHQIRKIIRLNEKLENEKMENEKIDHEQKLTIATMPDKVVDDGKRDMASQKAFTNTKYLGEDLLAYFIDDLNIESLIREYWNELLFIKSKSGAINLLDNHGIITEKEILISKSKQTNKMYNAVKNMCVATWFSLGHKPKRAIHQYKKKL